MVKASWREIGKSVIEFIYKELFMVISSYIVVPIAVSFCKKKDEHLPRWARWYEDDTYGINGDEYWKNEHMKDGKNRSWLGRVKWLYRNKIGVFSTEITGVKYEDILADSIETYGDIWIPSSDGLRGSGSCYVKAVTKKGKKVYGYFDVKVWGRGKYYIRTYMGHKLMDIAYIGLEKNIESKRKMLEKYLKKGDSKLYAKSVCMWHPIRIVG